MRMRSIDAWLDEYGASHRNPVNKRLHWVCVPIIVWCVIGLLWAVPAPFAKDTVVPAANWASIVVLATLIYYALLSAPLALGALPVFVAMLWSIDRLSLAGPRLLLGTSAVLFVIAWTGQFIGHAIEGKRPSFFRDIQFLLIGPLWLLADVYRRLGLRY